MVVIGSREKIDQVQSNYGNDKRVFGDSCDKGCYMFFSNHTHLLVLCVYVSQYIVSSLRVRGDAVLFLYPTLTQRRCSVNYQKKANEKACTKE